MNGFLTGMTPLGQSGPGSNVNEGLLHLLWYWNFTIRCSLVSYPGKHFFHGLTPSPSCNERILSPAADSKSEQNETACNSKAILQELSISIY